MKSLHSSIYKGFWCIDRFSRGVDTLCRKALVVLAASIVLVIGAQVFFRYALNNSLFWSEELGRVLLIWLSFTGACVAFRAQAHIGVDIVYKRFSPPIKKAARLLMLTGCAVFFSTMLYWGTEFASMIATQTTASLGIGKHIPFAIIPISGAIMLLHTLALMLETLSDISSTTKGGCL